MDAYGTSLDTPLDCVGRSMSDSPATPEGMDIGQMSALLPKEQHALLPGDLTRCVFFTAVRFNERCIV